MTPGSFHHVRRDPQGCARWLSHDAGLWRVACQVIQREEWTILGLHLQAPPDLDDYPDEDVRIVITFNRTIACVPVGADTRPWLHRHWRPTLGELLALPMSRRLPLENLLGALCLWYPGDPTHLHWHWHDGLDDYIRIVQRHLWSEEFWRRHQAWPVEDAPHGERLDGRPHPIRTPALRVA